jgi:hypothetical protein
VALDEYPFGKHLNLTAACRNLHLAVPTLGLTTREYYIKPKFSKVQAIYKEINKAHLIVSINMLI